MWFLTAVCWTTIQICTNRPIQKYFLKWRNGWFNLYGLLCLDFWKNFGLKILTSLNTWQIHQWILQVKKWVYFNIKIFKVSLIYSSQNWRFLIIFWLGNSRNISSVNLYLSWLNNCYVFGYWLFTLQTNCYSECFIKFHCTNIFDFY